MNCAAKPIRLQGDTFLAPAPLGHVIPWLRRTSLALSLAGCFLSLLLGYFSANCASLDWTQLPPLPDKIGFASPFAGVSGRALIVAGGANFPDKMPWDGGQKVWHDNAWLLDAPGGLWRQVGKLPRPLAYGVSVTGPDGVVCVGGSDSTRHYSEAFQLSWRRSKLVISPLPSLPISLAGAAGAVVGENLYVSCGSEQPGEIEASARTFVLNFGARKPAWREIPPLPAKPRLFAAGAAHRGAFYLIGGAALQPTAAGKSVRVYLKETWSYRPKEGWRRLSDISRPNVAAPSPAPFVNGNLLLLGGDDGSRVDFSPLDKHPGFPREILAYDPVLDCWRELEELPAPRATLPCVQWRGRFVLPSGEVRPGVRSPEVWSFTAP